MRLCGEEHSRYPDHANPALARDLSSLRIVGEEKSSAPLPSERNPFRLTPVQMPGNFRNDARIRCRLHRHPSGFQGGGQRPGARAIGVEGKLIVHGGRDDDLPVETPEQVEPPDPRQGDERARIRDDRQGHEAAASSSSSSPVG